TGGISRPARPPGAIRGPARPAVGACRPPRPPGTAGPPCAGAPGTAGPPGVAARGAVAPPAAPGGTAAACPAVAAPRLLPHHAPPSGPAGRADTITTCRSQQKTGGRFGEAAPRKVVRRRPTLPRGPPRSTIGAEGLNFRVRNGTGCFPFAMATET